MFEDPGLPWLGPANLCRENSKQSLHHSGRFFGRSEPVKEFDGQKGISTVREPAATSLRVLAIPCAPQYASWTILGHDYASMVAYAALTRRHLSGQI